MILGGIAASPGVAGGPVYRLETEEFAAGLSAGPLPRESRTARLIAGDSDVRVAYREAREIDVRRPELAVTALDAALRLVPLQTNVRSPNEPPQGSGVSSGRG